MRLGISGEGVLEHLKGLEDIVIRAATATDAPRASRLLRSWSHTYTLSPTGEGAEALLATLEVPAVAAFIGRSDVMYIVAELGEKLAGAAALQAGNRGVFTVHSSVGAVPIYERFGFVVSGEKIVGRGGVSVPMVLDLTRGQSGGA